MTNEALIIISAAIELFTVWFAFVMGKNWLKGVIIVNMLLISLLGAKLISIFGFTTNVGNVFFATVFIATQFLIIHDKSHRPARLIGAGLFFVVFYLVISQITLLLAGLPESANLNEAISTILSFTPRIALASLIAFPFSMFTNVFAFNFVKEKMKGDSLWASSIMGHLSGQIVDSVIFFSVAFLGVLSFSQLLQSITIGIIVKTTVGIFGIPFLYLSKRVQKSTS